MKYKKQYFYFLLIMYCLPVIVSAQNFSARLNYGYYTHNMSDFEDLQNSIIKYYNSLGLSVKAVETFPNYYSFQSQLAMAMFTDFSVFNFGIFWGVASTGGRIHYRDYSGEIKLDQIMTGHSFGLLFEKPFLKYKRYFLFISVQLSYLLTTIENRELRKILFIENLNNFQTSTNALGIEPGIFLQIPISVLFGRLYFGYLLSYYNAVQFSEFSKFDITTSEQRVKSNWNGIRFNIGIGYSF